MTVGRRKRVLLSFCLIIFTLKSASFVFADTTDIALTIIQPSITQTSYGGGGGYEHERSSQTVTTTVPLPMWPTSTLQVPVTSTRPTIEEVRFPRILDVRVEPHSGQSVQIIWETDAQTRGTFRFGNTTKYEIGTLSSDEFKNVHTIQLIDLKAGVVYLFKIFAFDRDDGQTQMEHFFILPKEEVVIKRPMLKKEPTEDVAVKIIKVFDDLFGGDPVEDVAGGEVGLEVAEGETAFFEHSIEEDATEQIASKKVEEKGVTAGEGVLVKWQDWSGILSSMVPIGKSIFEEGDTVRELVKKRMVGVVQAKINDLLKRNEYTRSIVTVINKVTESVRQLIVREKKTYEKVAAVVQMISKLIPRTASSTLPSVDINYPLLGQEMGLQKVIGIVLLKSIITIIPFLNTFFK